LGGHIGFYAARRQKVASAGSIRSGNALLLLGTTLWALGYPEQALAASALALTDAREISTRRSGPWRRRCWTINTLNFSNGRLSAAESMCDKTAEEL
jgi:hypothetical protein